MHTRARVHTLAFLCMLIYIHAYICTHAYNHDNYHYNAYTRTIKINTNNNLLDSQPIIDRINTPKRALTRRQIRGMFKDIDNRKSFACACMRMRKLRMLAARASVTLSRLLGSDAPLYCCTVACVPLELIL